MSTSEQRSSAFEEACRLIKATGTSPYNHFEFTLKVAQWLAGEDE